MSLRLLDLRKKYGRHAALDGVSIHVRPGDCYGFLGHNGAGKTTALRIALGLIRPDSGRILVEGFDAVRHPRETRARQGGLIETPGFYPWMSGRSNLVHLAGLSGLSRRDGRREADRLLDVVGLSSSGDRAAGGYSQGMRQRLGIAQALLGDPSLILLDEPLNGLDPEGIEEMRRLLVHLVREDGRTVLLSSHQLSEVAGICNRVGILRQGKVLLEAETKVLLLL
jgi:ABC-2 type transport system ATP-binding protein